MKTRNFDRGRNSAPVATKFRLSPPSGDDSDTFSIHVNILYYDYLTVGMAFSSYTKSGVQTGSAQLARAKSTRVLAGGLAQMLIVRHTWTHAHGALCSPNVAPWAPNAMMM